MRNPHMVFITDPRDILLVIKTTTLKELPWKPKVTVSKVRKKPKKGVLLLFNLHDREEAEEEGQYSTADKQVRLLPSPLPYLGKHSSKYRQDGWPPTEGVLSPNLWLEMLLVFQTITKRNHKIYDLECYSWSKLPPKASRKSPGILPRGLLLNNLDFPILRKSGRNMKPVCLCLQ